MLLSLSLIAPNQQKETPFLPFSLLNCDNQGIKGGEPPSALFIVRLLDTGN